MRNVTHRPDCASSFAKWYNMSECEEVFWVKESGSFRAAHLVQENDDGSAVFAEFETGRRIEGALESIVGSVSPPYEQTLTELKDDLVEADDISEPSILWYLGRKFDKSIIYSSIGTILVSINPYRNIADLYSNDVLKVREKYNGFACCHEPFA